MAIIGDRTTWRMSNQRTRKERGPLVRVTLPSGAMVKMHEADAIEKGYLPGGVKAAPLPGNKIAPLPANKSAPAPEVPPEDFSTIPGVGRASARSLVSQGLTTFAGLKTADLDALNLAPSVKVAIEAWRA